MNLKKNYWAQNYRIPAARTGEWDCKIINCAATLQLKGLNDF